MNSPLGASGNDREVCRGPLVPLILRIRELNLGLIRLLAFPSFMEVDA